MPNKKLILFIINILIISCSRDYDINKDKLFKESTITFKTKIQSDTKAVILENYFPTNSHIGIFAWAHSSTNITSLYIRQDLNNNQYTNFIAEDEFTGTTEAHYPINPDTLLNFYAYYPYTEAATANPLSIPFDLKKQDDIMWATPVLNRDKNSAAEPVNLAFNHILSAITLKFKKADNIKEEMVLQSISMENYPSIIQLNVQSGALSAAPSTTPYTLIDGQQKAITSQETTILTNYLLYPIEKPVFIVRMSNKDYRIESTKAFEKGKKQTYTFTIQAKDVVISGSITPWENGGESNETVYF